jgi:hypothetical protein
VVTPPRVSSDNVLGQDLVEGGAEYQIKLELGRAE